MLYTLLVTEYANAWALDLSKESYRSRVKVVYQSERPTEYINWLIDFYTKVCDIKLEVQDV